MKMNLKRLGSGLLVVGLAFSALGQAGDRKGHVMKEVWKEMNVPPAPVLSPEEGLKSITMHKDFKIELVAAEPLVEDPVAITFDEDGRMWVVEMRGFMPNVDGKGEDARIGVIAVLEDTNGDGKMDKRTDFLKDLQMPRAIGFAKGGVLVAEPPFLWFCEDLDGDLKADKKTKIMDDYGLQGPVEHTDNGLLRGLDNWYYNAKSTKRFRQVDGKWIVENRVFRGQWGITKDDLGRLYHNANSAPLYVDVVHGETMARNPHFDSRPGLKQKLYSDTKVWTGRVNPGINRGYQDNMLRDGKLAVFTAASGPVIYRGDQYPGSIVGDAFIPEPSGNMVRHQKIEWKNEKPSGANAYKESEWLISSDERFRPVNINNGPDGAVYIVDMYRGILQHRVYVTSFLRKQILERNLDRPIGLGRVYRVVHKGSPTKPVEKLSGKSAKDLVAYLSHDNGWYRDTAQRLIVDGGLNDAVPALKELAVKGKTRLARIHALWTLEGLGVVDGGLLDEVFYDSDIEVKKAALRIAGLHLTQKIEDEEEKAAQMGLLDRIMELTEDDDLGLMREVAFAVSSVEHGTAAMIINDLLSRYIGDEILRAALVSGFEGRELEFVQRLISAPNWTKSDESRTALLKDLAECVAREKDPARMARLMSVADSTKGKDVWKRNAVLDGVAVVASPSRGRKPKPMHYQNQPRAIAQLAMAKDGATKQRFGKIKGFFSWGAAAKPVPPPRAMTESEQSLFEQGKELYMVTCAACHQPNGLGEEGKAPPILDSPWLLGSADVAAAIVLNGVTGPIDVHGRTYNMTMPALQGFSDEQIAAILTYSRREWEHPADPVTPEQVGALRKKVGTREVPWTVEELKKLSK